MATQKGKRPASKPEKVQLDDPIFTSAQAAAYLEISQDTLRRRIQAGLIEPGRLPGSHHGMRFRKSQLDKLAAMYFDELPIPFNPKE